MVVLTLTKKINKSIAPFLLRNGLALRYALGRGVVADNPVLDGLLLINLAQRLLSLEIHDDSMKAVKDSRRAQSALDQWAEDTFDRIFGKSEEEERRKKMTDSELRIEVLDSYLRPALVNNGKWSDVAKWQFNNRLLKWARAEFLIAKHGPAVKDALASYPKLRNSPQLAIHPFRRGILQIVHGTDLDDTTKQIALPQTSLVERAFEMEDWKKSKDMDGVRHHLEKLASKLGGNIVDLRGGSLRFANIPPDGDVSGLSLEQILEVAGGHVAFCGPMNALCEERGIYQVWTKEYVELLARYLLKRTNEFQGETVVLDVGAGDGLLSKYLQFAIGDEIRPKSSQRGNIRGKVKGSRPQPASSHVYPSKIPPKVPSIIAIDDGSWKIIEKADVEKIRVEEALKKYSDDNTQLIVLCSWMPMGVDWSALFRQFNVHEYILIGECDEGSCGDNWETWGNPAFLSDIGQELTHALIDSAEGASANSCAIHGDGARQAQNSQAPIPPYEVDGYKRIDIDDLVPYQLSRFDSSVSRQGRTATFLRKFKK